MRNRAWGMILIVLLMPSLLGGCGWSTSSLTTGEVGVDVSYATAPGCRNVWITVKQVWMHTSPYAETPDAGWQKLDLSAAPLTINLSDPALSILNGGTGAATLAARLSLPASDYYQIRIFLAATEDPLERSAQDRGLQYNNQVDAIDPDTGAATPRPLRIPAAGSGIRIVRDAASPITVEGGSYARYGVSFNLTRDLVKTDREGTGAYEYILKPQPLIINMRSVGGIRGSIKTFANMSGFDFVVKAVQAGNEIMSCTTDGVDSSGNLLFSLYPLPATEESYNVVVQGRKTDTFLIESVPVKAWPAAPFASLYPVPIVNGREYQINFSVARPTGASLDFSQTSAFEPECIGCHTPRVYVTGTHHLDPFTGRFATPVYLSNGPLHVSTYSSNGFHYLEHPAGQGNYKVTAKAPFFTSSATMDITPENAGQTITKITSLSPSGSTARVSGRIILGQGAPATMTSGSILITCGGLVIDRVDAAAAMQGSGSYPSFTVPTGSISSHYGLYAFGWNSAGGANDRAFGNSTVDLRAVTTDHTSADITMYQLQ